MLRSVAAVYFLAFLFWTGAWGFVGRHDFADVSGVVCIASGVAVLASSEGSR